MAKAQRSTPQQLTLSRAERKKCQAWLDGLNGALNSYVKERSALTRLLLMPVNDVSEQVKALDMLAAGRVQDFQAWAEARNG